MVGVFVGFSRIFVLKILIFKGLTARRLYKSFGVKALNDNCGSYLVRIMVGPGAFWKINFGFGKVGYVRAVRSMVSPVRVSHNVQ
jgi:hypothetical protein